MELLNIRPAQNVDRELVVSIMDAASRWLLEKGIAQWPLPYPRQSIDRAIGEGSQWICWAGGQSIATFRTASSDPIWSDKNLPALYLQAIAKRRESLRSNVVESVAAWAKEQVLSSGLKAIRLDCWSGNAPLRRLYESVGFVHVDDVVESDGTRSWTVSRFEIQLP